MLERDKQIRFPSRVWLVTLPAHRNCFLMRYKIIISILHSHRREYFKSYRHQLQRELSRRFWDHTYYIFGDITLCSEVMKIDRRLGRSFLSRKLSCCLIHAGFYWAYSLTMNMVIYSRRSIDLHRATRRYIPDNRALHSHRCENLTSRVQLKPVAENSFSMQRTTLGYWPWRNVKMLNTKSSF
jgi:hypothetical protein